MELEYLILLSIVIILIVFVILSIDNDKKCYLNEEQKLLLDYTNMRHTALDGNRLPAQRLPVIYSDFDSQLDDLENNLFNTSGSKNLDMHKLSLIKHKSDQSDI